MHSIREEYSNDCLLVKTALDKRKIDTKVLEVGKRLKVLVDHSSSVSFDYTRVKMLCHALERHITTKALHNGLYFRESKKLAVINGAGIAGLTAAFELRARNWNVVITELRDFTRWNVINLGMEVQAFLNKFSLMKKFEESVAARITEHKIVLIDKDNQVSKIGISDVRDLKLDKSMKFETEKIDQLFVQDGIYSVKIKTLQNFLAQHALELGVNIFGKTTARVVSRTSAGGVSEVKIADNFLEPDLFFIAEGAHSKTAKLLEMESETVENVCSAERWGFGNLEYFGKETFVISLIDASEKELQIGNVIFNALEQVINVAVTLKRGASDKNIEEEVLKMAKQVLNQKVFPIKDIECQLLATNCKPVEIVNRMSEASKDNVFSVGDAVGSSSPLAGSGGTIGISLVQRVVEQLLNDYNDKPKKMHENFNRFSKAYATRWIKKSEGVKEFCLSFLKSHVKEGSGT